MGTNSEKLELTAPVDVRILQKIQDDFAAAMDLSCTIMDLEANPITKPSNTHWICHGLIRKTEEGERRCGQSDMKCGQEAAHTRGPAIHTCHAGLTDFAVPIEVDGSLIAYLFGGQVLAEEPDPQTYRQKAEELGKDLGFDPKEYLKALEEIPVLSMDRIEAAARLMHTVANCISDLANQRLHAQRRAESITTSLHQIGLTIASGPDLEQVLRVVVENAIRVIGADLVTLYLYNEETDEFSLPVGVGLLDEEMFKQSKPKKDGVAAKIAKERKCLAANEVTRHPDFKGLKFPQREGVVSSVGLPIVARDSVVGVLFVNFRTPYDFSPEDKQLIATLADQAAVAIDNAQLHERMRNSVARLEALHQIKSHIDSVFELNDILQVTLEEGLAVLGTGEGSLMLIDSEANQLEIRAWMVKGEFVSSKEHRTLNVGQGIAGQVAVTGRVYNCPDTSRDEHFVTSFMGRDIGSLLSVPIKSPGKMIGIINVDHPKPNFFAKDDEQFLVALADHAAAAIESYRLRDLGVALSSTLNREEVAKLIIERTAELIGCDACTIYHLNADTKMLIPMASCGEYAEQCMAFPIMSGEGITGAIVESGVGEIVNEAHLDPRAVQVPDTSDIPTSLLVEPLLVRERVIGAITLHRFGEKVFFNEGDARLLSTLATQAALALDNARLFDQVRSDLDRRVEELEALAEIDDAITTSDLDTVLGKILKTAAQIISVDNASLLLMDESGEYLVPRATYGAPWKPGSPERFRIGKLGTTGWVAENKRTALIANVHSEEWRDIYVEVRPETRSELCVPLLDESGEVVGIINLESPKLGAFSEDDQRLLEALARQAVIAIHNQRSYQAAEQARLVFEALRDIDSAIASGRDLEEVLSLILDKALELVKAPSGNIMLYDRFRGELWTAAGRGTMPGKERARQAVGEGIVGLVAQKIEPLRVSDVTKEPWRHIYVQFIDGIRSELAVPMVFDGVLGVLNAESPQIGAFSEDHQRLLEALADQAVIAIQEARTRERFHRLYLAAQEIIQAELNEGCILEVALRIGMERTRAFSASARLLDESGKWLKTTKHLGEAYDGAWKPIAVGKRVNGWVAEHRETRLVGVHNVPEEIVGTWEGHPATRWKLVVPMMVGNEYFGNLGFDCGGGEEFEEDEILLIQGITDQAAAALQRLWERSRAEEAERRQALTDTLTMLQTLRTNLLHGFSARNLVGFRVAARTLRRELDKGIATMNQEMVYEILDTIEQTTQESSRDLRKIVDLPTKGIVEQATLVDINVVVRGAHDYALNSKPENVEVQLFFAEDLPTIKIDPLQLSLTFENLFVNAYQVLRDWDGERRLTVTTFKALGDKGIIKVGAKFSNTGPPVPDSVADRLFKEPIGERRGLYTSRWVLELYSGTISLAENEPGRVSFVVAFEVKGGR